MIRNIFIALLFLGITLPIGAQNLKDSISQQYERSWELKDGIYRVMQNRKVGVVKADGQIIIPCEYQQIWNLDEHGFFRVMKNGKVGIFNLEGQMIISPEYDQVWSFEDGRAKVMKHGKLGYYNMEGTPVIPCLYQQIWSFENDRARAMKNGKIGYLDLSGMEIVPFEYQQIWSFNNGRARVLKNGLIGYIDTSGLEIIPCEYQQIWEFEDGKAKAMKNGQIVWIDASGFPAHSLDNEVSPIVQPDEIAENTHSESETVIKTHKDKQIIIEDESGKKTHIKVLGGNIIIKENGDDTLIEIESNNNRRYRRRQRHPFKGHYTGIELGLNGYMDKDQNTSFPDHPFMELNEAKSRTFAINPFQWSIGLQRRGNIGLVTGLGVEWNNYHFDNNYLIDVNDAGIIDGTSTDRNIKKNKLVTTYVNAPLLLEFQIPNRRNHSELYLSMGGVGGYRISSKMKTTFKDGDKDEVSSKGSYSLRDWRYGAMVRMGYRAINLYSTYYFSSLFEDNKGPEVYPFSIGLSIYFDM
jgi:hypothetical protein